MHQGHFFDIVMHSTSFHASYALLDATTLQNARQCLQQLTLTISGNTGNPDHLTGSDL